MEQLSLSFLGTFQVRLRGRVVTNFRSVNVQGLLVYLAMQRQRPFPRDSLATLFWPDEPDKVARTNFRQSLYQLRKLLEHDTETPLFLVDRQTVQINPDAEFDLDVLAFLRAVKQGDFATAVSQYRDELLPGFNCDSLVFDDWLRRERERLHLLALDAFTNQTEILLNTERYSDAQALAHRHLSLEPWREAAQRQLMLALALAGETKAALTQFDVCKQVLWEELGAEPEAETIALAEKIDRQDDLILLLTGRPSHNLIAPVSPLFGREQDRAFVTAHISDANFRLVTLTGEGGIGKTRLGLEIGWALRERYRDGCWFVPLIGIDAAGSRSEIEDRIATAVSHTIGHPFSGQESPKAQLFSAMRGREMLLLLDNFEHLLAGAKLVIDLLEQAPGVCVICTSRLPLNFVAEWVYTLQPLATPPPPEPPIRSSDKVKPKLDEFAAIQLFMDRAKRLNPRFELTEEIEPFIAELCRLLYGVPLALELAAAALGKRPLSQLLASLQRSIDTLTTQKRDLPARHRSMRAVFETSWQLLSEYEQAYFALLSVFRGGFSAEAAFEIAGAALTDLYGLVDKSLLREENGRFYIHELLRQYLGEKLQQDGHKPLQMFTDQRTFVYEQHSHYFLTFVAERADALVGPAPNVPADEIETELDNIRLAWDTAVENQQWHDLLAALIPLSEYYQIRGLYREGESQFAKAAAQFDTELYSLVKEEQSELLAHFLAQQAAMIVRISDYTTASKLIENALPHAINAKNGWLQGRLAITKSETLWRQGEYREAQQLLENTLATIHPSSLDKLTGLIYFHLGAISLFKGEIEQSLIQLEKSLVLWREMENVRWEGFTQISIGAVATDFGDYKKASDALSSALSICRLLKDKQGESFALTNFGKLSTAQKEYTRAQTYIMQSLQLAEQSGDLHNIAVLKQNLAWNTTQAKNWDVAQTYAIEALRFWQQVGDLRGEGLANFVLGEINIAKNEIEAAKDYYEKSYAIGKQVEDKSLIRNAFRSLTKIKRARQSRTLNQD